MDLLADVSQAEQRIRPYIRETPLEHSLFLSTTSGCNVHLKLENLQYTGSFKVRGAMNKLLSLSPEQQKKGVVTASSGNHGIAVAYGLYRLGMRGLVFVPETASSTKVAAIRQYGTEVQFYGEDSVWTEEHARNYASKHNMEYISPYNDAAVISGQGTIGVELDRQLDNLDAVLVAVGGGGLISGVGGYLKARRPSLTVVGCAPQHSPVMFESMKAGRIVEMESLPTFSDGTAGGIEAGSLTFPLCQQIIDKQILVSEAEIRSALLLFMETHHQLIEGSAAVPVAALLQQQAYFRGQRVALVLCGANISLNVLKGILAENTGHTAT